MTCSTTDWLTAIGTVGAVVVALFGNVLRGIIKPKLMIAIDDPLGVAQPVSLRAPDGSERHEKARYYHIRVRNNRRWIPAKSVQVYLLRIEVPAAVGYRTEWSGDGLPLVWQHQSVRELRPTIGESLNADLLYVVKGKWLEFGALVLPIGLTNRYAEQCELVLTVQARSELCDSQKVRVHVIWDGGWHDGATEMRQHLVIEEMPEEAA